MDTSVMTKSTYEEDVSVLAAGTELVGFPCTVWDMTVCLEADATATVNFSNSITSYNASTRGAKVVIDGPGTVHLVFPKGLYLSTGLCAVSNVGSVDIRVSYE